MSRLAEVVRPAGRITRDEQRLHALAGVLPDGTSHHVPIGEVWADRTAVCCHLCGGWFRSVSAHLPAHGWTRERYLDAFGLERGVSLECIETRERRAAGFAPRRTFEPEVREGIEAGHALARSGALTEYAAKAARGRPHSLQRRAKTLDSLSRISPEAKAEGIRRRRRHELDEVARRTARTFGFSTVDAFVLDRVSRGDSLAAVSREAGLHKDWFQRHLAVVAPGAAARLDDCRLPAADRRLLELVGPVGFTDVAVFLHTRHHGEGLTVHAIARQIGVSRSCIESAMDRHGVRRTKR